MKWTHEPAGRWSWPWIKTTGNSVQKFLQSPHCELTENIPRVWTWILSHHHHHLNFLLPTTNSLFSIRAEVQNPMDRLNLALTSPPKFVLLGYSSTSTISTATRTNQLCGSRRLARSRIKSPPPFPRICASAVNRRPNHRIVGNVRIRGWKWCFNVACNLQ